MEANQTTQIVENNFVSPEAELDIRMYGKYLAFLRRHPVHAVRVLWGIVIPPHESTMLNTAWQGYRTNIYTCSRGTSKSFVIGSLFTPTKALLYRNSNILIASASRFRGGKLVLKDTSRLLSGRLKNQKLPGVWGQQSLTHKTSLIKKDPDMWYQEYNSNSTLMTIPTNNDESILGNRANIIDFDEFNTFDGEVVERVLKPFLNVGSDFENPALGSQGNQIFQVGTIDYTYRHWFKEISTSKAAAMLQFELQQTLQEGNWLKYDRIMKEHGSRLSTFSTSITRFDYTDLVIPTEINGFKVSYPGAKDGKSIIYDIRDKCNYIYTYPVTKGLLEEPLDLGIVDKETWEAQQRNEFIRADGNVFPYDLIERATGPIYSESEEVKRGWNAEDEGRRYLPPVLFECSDPCVLGVDNARINDFAAFVVIRLGDSLVEDDKRPEYILKQNLGKTPWANVIWAEQHQQMTAKEAADKIRQLKGRYNIVANYTCPGIAMDARGGGANVRDELVNPSPDVDPLTGLVDPAWSMPIRIFDPTDKDERLGQNLIGSTGYWHGLKLLYTNDTLNQDLIGFVKAQLQTGKLFVGSSKSRSIVRDISNPIYPGWVGVDVLRHQLLRIQAVLTEHQKSIRYEMPGDPNKVENKKDMLFAFLYAGYAMREWITQAIKANNLDEPVTYGEVFSVGAFRRW